MSSSISTCYQNQTIPLKLGIKECSLGFYCPRVTSSPLTWPEFCPPDIVCSQMRLLGMFCKDGVNATFPRYGAMGLYEPVVCPPGMYCPTTKQIYNCPQGYFCPTGTSSPKACDTVSFCPEGSTSQTSLNGIIGCIVLDLALALLCIVMNFIHKKKVSSLEQLTSIHVDNQDTPKEKVSASPNQRKLSTKHVSPDEDDLPSSRPSVSPGSPLSPSAMKARVTVVKNALAQNFRKSLNQRDLRMHFEMKDLGYALPNGKSILKGITGHIQHGKMTAIMGPSGAGKTTFMNVLCGKVKRTFGTLKISGKEAELEKYKKICGFVPQEDVMHRELTVRENILHSARIRLPSNWSAEEVEYHTDSVIEALNLKHVSHTLIGDGISRGVSGGQRKRVNIGMEVAATPLCLFLDEPTSGLDSTSSLEVMDMLDKISEIGMTIVAVIHQPRVEIFTKFHDVLMIAPGGRTAYLGPTKGARPFFEKLGYEFPNGSNDADVLMDILSGQGINPKHEYTVQDLVGIWDQHYESITKKEGEKLMTKVDEEFHKESLNLVKERGANFFWQFFYAHNISLVQQYRQISSLALEVFVSGFTGLIMGMSLSGLPETYVGIFITPFNVLSIAPNLWLTVQVQFLSGLAIALAASPAGTKIFSEELPIYWRNASSGHSTLAYFGAKTLSSSYRMALSALHFSALMYAFATPIVPYTYHFLGTFLCYYGVYGLSAFVSMVVKRENATLLAVVIALLSAVFCGYGLTLKKVKSWGIYFFWALQFNMWSAEAFYSHTLQIYETIYDNELANSDYGYSIGNTSLDYGMMFLIGSLWRVVAYLAMIFMNRDKQK